MLSQIKQLFEKSFISPSSGLSADGADKKTTQLAIAALLIEVAESDYQDAPEERHQLLRIVKNSFGLSLEEANILIELAKEEHKNSTDYFQFTRLINDNYSAEQKIKLIENLWQVAFADSHLDKYEEHVIRRISDLIYVSHSDFMATKLRVQDASLIS